MKRKFTSEAYAKMGNLDLGCKVYIMKAGKKIWGSVSFLSFCGFKGARNGLVLLGIEPFVKR